MTFLRSKRQIRKLILPTISFLLMGTASGQTLNLATLNRGLEPVTVWATSLPEFHNTPIDSIHLYAYRSATDSWEIIPFQIDEVGEDEFYGDDDGVLDPNENQVDELVFMHNSATLLAATHGRGLFTADLTLPPFDYDFDGTIDLADHVALAGCLTGPAGGLLANCGAFDDDNDNDVDLDDFGAYQNAFSSP